jgi:putative Holliday junction resolvase
VHVGRPPGELKAIAGLVTANDVSCVVVGHPLSLSGEPGPRARHTEELAGTLGSMLDVPVVLHDERLSTAQAERELRRAGASGRERRRVVDRSAAVVILQSYLDHRRG